MFHINAGLDNLTKNNGQPGSHKSDKFYVILPSAAAYGSLSTKMQNLSGL